MIQIRISLRYVFWIVVFLTALAESSRAQQSQPTPPITAAQSPAAAAAGQSPQATPGQTPTTSSQSEDCGHFVQQFYNWYVATETALMKRNGLGSALEVTLREKRSSLSPELVKGLKEDLAASEKSPAEIVGLDFDPFLNAQEIAERYLVGKITPKGDHYWVEVFGVWEGQKNSNPDVVPELAFENGHWIFTNFHYGKTDIPVNENLVSILEVLKKDRQKAAK